MKKISRAVAVSGGCVLGLLAVAGCQPIRLPVTAALASSIGSFLVQAGVPTTQSGPVTFNNTTGISVGSGVLRLDPSVITVTAAAPGKLVTLQAPSATLMVTARVAPLSERETVCETGETYGPFDVTLDATLQPVSVDPSSVALTQSTIALLNAGEFSLCLEVVSPVDGTVTIASLAFDLGL